MKGTKNYIESFMYVLCVLITSSRLAWFIKDKDKNMLQTTFATIVIVTLMAERIGC